MTSFGFALLAALCWGFAPFLEKAGLRGVADPSVGLVIRSVGVVIGTLCLIPFMSALIPRLEAVPPRNMVFLIAGGILASIVGQAFFYRALKFGEMSRSVAIGATYPVIACLVGLIFLKEPLTFSKAFGVFFVTLGVMLLK